MLLILGFNLQEDLEFSLKLQYLTVSIKKRAYQDGL